MNIYCWSTKKISTSVCCFLWYSGSFQRRISKIFLTIFQTDLLLSEIGHSWTWPSFRYLSESSWVCFFLSICISYLNCVSKSKQFICIWFYNLIVFLYTILNSPLCNSNSSVQLIQLQAQNTSSASMAKHICSTVACFRGVEKNQMRQIDFSLSKSKR